MESNIIIRDIHINNLFMGYDGKVFKWELSNYEMVFSGVDIDEIIKHPIQLNEDLLIKVGAVKNKYYSSQYDLNNVVSIILTDRGWTIGSDDVIVRDMQYVHQLQNVYYALTGKELEVIL